MDWTAARGEGQLKHLPEARERPRVQYSRLGCL